MLRQLALAVALTLGLAAPLVAQTQPTVLQPETAVVTPGGVDLNTGQYRDEGVDLSMGSDANGGITFKRVDQGMKPFRSNWHIFLNKELRPAPPTPPLYNHTVEAVTWELESSAVTKTWLRYLSGPMAEQGIPSPGYTKLEYVGSAWRFTMADGTVIGFEPSSSSDGDVSATSMTRKDGVVYTFTYDSGGDPVVGGRLRRVKSNTGYELILEYNGSTDNRITKACVFNSSVVQPPVGNTLCPTGAGVQTSSYGYTLVGGSRYALSSVTDAVGKVWSTAVQSGSRVYSKPGVGAWLTNTLGGAPDGGFSQPPDVVLSQQLADGRSITYAYANLLIYESDTYTPNSKPKSGRGTGWTVNGTQTTQVGWAASQSYLNGQPSPLYISPAPNLMIDALGRQSGATYEGGTSPYGNAITKTLIGGRLESYVYVNNDNGVNLASRTWHARPGTNDPDLTTSYTYDCTITFNCAKPTTITDPNAQGSNDPTRNSDYVYSPTTGLLTTETMPDPDGAGPQPRPQKRYTWVQQTAYFKNTSGVLGAGAPIWVIGTISECRTSASCAGTADETLTTFTYPTSPTSNNILPLSKTVQAGNNTLVATTSYTYDADGNKLTEDGPLQNTATVIDISRWQYDAKRRVTASMTPDPDGAGGNVPLAVRNTFDDAGRLIKVENGKLLDQAIDWSGFAVIDSVETDYDALDRKTQERKKDASSVIQALTQYSYDSFGRLDCTAVRMNKAAYGSLPASACSLGTQGSDGPDRITRNTYDLGDQLLTVTEAYGTPDQALEASYAYNDSGKKTTLIDARGFKASMGYDGHDRQTQWNFPDKVTAGTVSTTDYEAYTYDNNGNRTSQRKRDGSLLNFAYDNLNRMTVKTVPGSTATTHDVSIGYDLQGHQLSAQFTEAGAVVTGTEAGALTSDYDALGRLTATTLVMGGVSRTLGYGYDIRGFRTSLTHPDSTVFSYTPDTLGRLTALTQSATTLRGYSYNSDGRLTASALGSGTPGSTTYGYDTVGRLNVLGQNIAGTAADVNWTFTYSPASQTLTQARDNDAYAWTGAVAATRTYATNGLNQYTQVVSGGTNPFTYDLDGNLTGDGTSTYAYDAENRLVLANVGGQTVSLRYDTMGRLYEVAPTAGTTTRFLYDGDELVGEYDTSGAMLKRYVHGIAVDDPVIEYAGSALTSPRHLLADRQGSIVGVTDNAGTIIAKNTYDEYGIPKSDDPGGLKVVGRFAYTGQIWLPEIGMYHYKARLYSPTLGRFMQTDPIGYDDQINLYAYVDDDPTNKGDPSGLAGSNDHFEDVLAGRVPAAVSPEGGRAGAGVLGNIVIGVGSLFVAPEALAARGIATALGMTRTAQVAVAASRTVVVERFSIARAGVRALESGAGKPIAGNGAKAVLRQADRLAAKYGGEAKDYAKVTTGSTRTSDGASVQIHAYKNVETGAIYEPKLKIQ